MAYNDLTIDLDDVIEYINDVEELKNLEAFFLSYFENNKDRAKEVYNLIIAKYNILLLPPSQINEVMQVVNKNIKSDISFNEYIKSIKNIDVNGICYMMIPMLKYYGVDGMYYNNFKIALDVLADIYKLDYKDCDKKLRIALDNYDVFKQVDFNENGFITIKINREDSYNMIRKYYDIYGKDKVIKLKYEVKRLTQ